MTTCAPRAQRTDRGIAGAHPGPRSDVERARRHDALAIAGRRRRRGRRGLSGCQFDPAQRGRLEEHHRIRLDPVAARGLIPARAAGHRLAAHAHPCAGAHPTPHGSAARRAVRPGAPRFGLEVAIGQPWRSQRRRFFRPPLVGRKSRLLCDRRRIVGCARIRDLKIGLRQRGDAEALAVEQVEPNGIPARLGIAKQYLGRDRLAGLPAKLAHLARAAVDPQTLPFGQRRRLDFDQPLLRRPLDEGHGKKRHRLEVRRSCRAAPRLRPDRRRGSRQAARRRTAPPYRGRARGRCAWLAAAVAGRARSLRLAGR